MACEVIRAAIDATVVCRSRVTGIGHLSCATGRWRLALLMARARILTSSWVASSITTVYQRPMIRPPAMANPWCVVPALKVAS